MKKTILNSLGTISTGLCLALILLAQEAGAATTNLWWDNNGASAATSGTWDATSTKWAPSATLTASTGAFSSDNFPEFAAGSTTITALTMTVNTPVTCVGMATGLSGALVTTTTFSGSGSISIDGGIQQAVYCGSGALTGNFVYSVPIIGTGGITQHGNGYIALYGSNSFAAGLATTGGQFVYYNNNSSFGTGGISIGGTGMAFLSSAATALTISNNFTFPTANYNINLVGGNAVSGNPGTTFSGSFTMPATGTTTLYTSSTATTVDEIAGPISGAGVINFADVGTMYLAGTNTYTGNTILSNTITVALIGSGTLGSGAYAGNIANASILVYNSSANQTLSGVVSGAGSLTQKGTGKLTLSGANTYTGTTTNAGGVINLAHAESANSSGPFGKQTATAAGTIVMTGGTLQYTSTNKTDYTGRFSTAAGQKYNVDVNGQAVTWATALSSSGGLMNVSDSAGGGTLTISETAGNTFTGGATLNSGNVSIGGSVLNPFGTSAGTLTLAGGVLLCSGDRGTTANNIPNPVNLTGNYAFSAATTTGTRNLVFGGTLGGTAGTLTLQNTEATNGGAIFAVRFTNAFSFGRPMLLTNYTAGNTLEMDIWNTGAGDQTYSGVISGNGTIKRSATTANTGGRVIFTGTNIFTGGTSLNDGEIAMGSDCAGVGDAPTSGPVGTGTITVGNERGKVSAFGAARNLFNHFLFSGGTHLTLLGANDLTLSGNLDMGGQTVTITNNNTGASTLSGIVSNGSFTFQGPNSLTLTGANTYTGKTTVNASTLVLGATGSLASTNVTIAAGATFDVSAISAYTSSGGVTASGTATAATINGASGGTVDLSLQPITLTFDGSDPALTIAQGTLVLNGNAFTVNGSVLPAGTYPIISQTIGTITSSGTFTVTGTALGSGIGFIMVNDANVNLVIPPTPVFSSLAASQSSTYGPSTITVGGMLGAAGPIYPAMGETITVTINGNAQTTTINDGMGDFTLVYNSSTIPSGSYPIVYSYAGDSSLDAATDASTTLTVGQASLTVTANDASRPFGALNPAFSASYTNFVNGQTLGTSGVTGSPALTSVDTNADVGTYTITNSIGTLASSNYSFSLVNGNLFVTNALSTNVVTADTNPALPGTTVTFTATLATLAPSLAVPTNLVQFLIDSNAYGSPVYLTNGIAQTTNASLSHGYHVIEADYAGDTNALGVTNIVGSTNVMTQLINTPPVAGPASYGRPRGAGFHINVSDLLTNASDPDGDAVSLFSVGSTSTNGAIISNSGGVVSYTPTSTNADVTDTFTYTVQDIYGATNLGTVTVTILPDDNGPSVNITGENILGDGTVLLSFAGIPGRTYLIQATTNLTPTIIWTNIGTNMAGTNGLFQFTDLDATNYPTRYYRTAKP